MIATGPIADRQRDKIVGSSAQAEKDLSFLGDDASTGLERLCTLVERVQLNGERPAVLTKI